MRIEIEPNRENPEPFQPYISHIQWPNIMSSHFLKISERCAHMLAIEPRKSIRLTMKLSGSFCCNLQLSRKPRIVANALIEHEVVAKAWIKH